MEALNQVIARRCDGLLYHYTTQRGLLGIIRDGEIWATDIRYLNDSSEFRLACDCAIKVIDEKVRGEKDEQRKEALEILRKGAHSAGINVSVVSFSAEGNLLSQWRAYGGGSSGFSIGFEYDALKRAADQEEWVISPCVYDLGEQQKVMTAIVDDALAKLLKLKAEGKRIPRGGGMSYLLNRYAAIFKDNSFREEREWRLISRPLNAALGNYAYREGRSTIVPYFRFPLPRLPSGHPWIKELIVGPVPDPELATSAVTSLLASRDLDQLVGIKTSTIPYRNW